MEVRNYPGLPHPHSLCRRGACSTALPLAPKLLVRSSGAWCFAALWGYQRAREWALPECSEAASVVHWWQGLVVIPCIWWQQGARSSSYGE